MKNESWLTSTISQPLQILADINYCIKDYRGENYFSLFIKKIKPIIKHIVLWIRDIVIKPQFIEGNFGIHSPPYKITNISSSFFTSILHHSQIISKYSNDFNI